MEDVLLIAKALRCYAEKTDSSEESVRCLEIARNLEAQEISRILDDEYDLT